MRMRAWIRNIMMLAGMLLCAAWWSLVAQGVQAHGGGTPQLVDAAIGEYRIFAWTQPEPLRAGEVHVTVSVTLPASAAVAPEAVDSAVRNAAVNVHFQPQDGSARPFTAAAQPQTSLGTVYYEADAEIPTAGDWAITVQVDGPHGAGDVMFQDVVRPARTVNWTVIGGVALGLLALIISVRSWQSRTAKQAPVSRHTGVQNA